MANETSNNPNQGIEILNEGRTIPLLTPQIDYEEKGKTIPLINPQPSQNIPTNTNPPKTSEK